MADQVAHSDEPHAGSEASSDDHASDRHVMGDEHEGTALGPVDVPMWGAAVLGVALGLVVFLAFVYAVS